MKITALIENTALSPNFATEHGFSLYIETAHHKILFDAGQSEAFADNAEKMGIDLRQVDLAFLSHGHYDHSGGLKRFLQINDHAPVYISPYAFEPHYHGQERYIGIDPDLKDAPRLLQANGECLGDGLLLVSSHDKTPSVPVDPAGLTVLENGKYLPEDFRHEQYLQITENGKRILLSGCSHKGIINIVRWFSPDVLIGGFHFMNLDPAQPADKSRLDAAADALLAAPTAYYTGHCTGEAPYAYLKEKMTDRLTYLSTGMSVEL